MTQPMKRSVMPRVSTVLRPALLDGCQNSSNRLGLGPGALRAFAVETDAHVAGVHVAAAHDEHRVDLRFFGVGNFAFDVVGREVSADANLVPVQFVDDLPGIINAGFEFPNRKLKSQLITRHRRNIR